MSWQRLGMMTHITATTSCASRSRQQRKKCSWWPRHLCRAGSKPLSSSCGRPSKNAIGDNMNTTRTRARRNTLRSSRRGRRSRLRCGGQSMHGIRVFSSVSMLWEKYPLQEGAAGLFRRRSAGSTFDYCSGDGRGPRRRSTLSYGSPTGRCVRRRRRTRRCSSRT